jgi:hypothetical protein
VKKTVPDRDGKGERTSHGVIRVDLQGKVFGVGYLVVVTRGH